jgi:imidazolonepropionase-like amidohydrolase
MPRPVKGGRPSVKRIERFDGARRSSAGDWGQSMSLTKNVLGLVLAVGLSLGGSPTFAQALPAASFRITNVRAFDGERVHQNTDVAVENGVIRAVARDTAQWRHLPSIDGTGSTLLPGLIDAHVHVHDADELRQALRFGVTTALDLGATIEPEALFALRAAADTAHDMADLRVAGFVATAYPPPGLLTSSAPRVTTPEDARQFVAMRRAEGVDHVKIGLNGEVSANTGAPRLDEPTVRAVVAAAHASHLVAVAHVETLDDVRIALASGVDAVVHTWRREGAQPEMARQVVERGTLVMPVLAPPDSFLPEGRAGLLSDPRFQGVLSEAIKDHLDLDRSYPAIRITSAPIEVRTARRDAALAAARSLREAGAKFIAGSDASRNGPVAFGISFHRELELLHDIGLTPSAVLAAATSNTADVFRLHDRGRIGVGLRADLVLVRGDPTADILATRDIIRVWKAGHEVNMTR